MQDVLFDYPNLHVRAGSVFDLVFDHSAEPAAIPGTTTGTGVRRAAVGGVRLGASIPVV